MKTIDLPVASEQQIRERNLLCKPLISNETSIREYLDINNLLQQESLKLNFNPSPVVLPYDLPYKFDSFVNAISSTAWKGTVGRRLNLILRDTHYGFFYGILQLRSPIGNTHIFSHLKDIYGKTDFAIFNSKYVEISVCVGSGILTKYLSGKLLVYSFLSKEVVGMWNSKYDLAIEHLFTTSLYGKSSIYNRIANLKYLGLTKGYNSLFLPEEVEWIKQEYARVFPSRAQKKTAKAVHLMRLYEHLYVHYIGKMPFYPLRTPRGVYLYMGQFSLLEDNVEYWKVRWWKPRRERVDAGEVKI